MAAHIEDKVIDKSFSKVYNPLSKELKKAINVRLEKVSAKLHPEARGFVYMKRVPNSLKTQQLKEYFLKFGDVKNIRLSGNKKKKNFLSGVVEFENPALAVVIGNHLNHCESFLSYLQCNYLDESILYDQVYKGNNKHLRPLETGGKPRKSCSRKIIYLDSKLKQKLRMMETLGLFLKFNAPIHNGLKSKRKRKINESDDLLDNCSKIAKK
ncbi:DgyrCDS8500 [Dimorphilus gyrociliatus]|uniref:DgyrCDS8500 n=1 Tax=Dimorphilus gyrociliatus TaxID=2664684 RepID=A0A7I8VUK9_9ANNE|nr:DgyrCDS8500 [Dimorphilus gyrociliatus]